MTMLCAGFQRLVSGLITTFPDRANIITSVLCLSFCWKALSIRYDSIHHVEASLSLSVSRLRNGLN